MPCPKALFRQSKSRHSKSTTRPVTTVFLLTRSTPCKSRTLRLQGRVPYLALHNTRMGGQLYPVLLPCLFDINTDSHPCAASEIDLGCSVMSWLIALSKLVAR